MRDEISSMRETLRAALPSRAFLRRDRGDALLVTNAPVFTAEPIRIPGFILEQQGKLLRIYPDESRIHLLEDKYPEPPDYLSASLLRFRGKTANHENLLLFTCGAKLLDALPSVSEAEIAAFDRSLRQRAAAALRSGSGGGLYASAIILNQINIYHKGEQTK